MSLESILKNAFPSIKKNENLSSHTTFKIGGNAEYFLEVESKEQLTLLLEFVRKNSVHFFLIGAGSNVLFSDEGFDGIVVKLTGEFKRIASSGETLTCGGGVNLATLQAFSVKNGLSGFEKISGIPGSVGGALAINAGTKYGNISDNLVSTEIVFEEKGYIKLVKSEVSFNYRHSSLKGKIITAATFKMVPKEPSEILKEMNRVMASRIESQPNEPSAGCIFKNPGSAHAGKLIDDCGLKGKQIGGAMISNEHANFIINTGGAKRADVLKLIDLVRHAVLEKFGINLELEIILA